MTDKPHQPSSDPSSAPESGTVREDTSKASTSDRGTGTTQGGRARSGNETRKDDPSSAPEER